MPRLQHSNKEKEAINRAYWQIHHAAQLARRELWWEKLTRIESKQRSSLLVARAIMVESFEDAFTHRRYPAASAFYLSDGCQFAALLGAACKEDQKNDRSRAYAKSVDRKALAACREAHREALDRWLDAERATWNTPPTPEPEPVV
jgi:malonyl CoA-acyl carrier protein transacylase